MMKKLLLSAASLVAVSFYGQTLEISSEIRPRFEYRHGYKTLAPNDAEAASFISQRSRLNTLYHSENIEAYLSLQDVRVWGDVPQLNISDKNQVMIHEAWGKFKTSEKTSVKLGRQVISYDDQRFFGGVGWAQQARSHDAALLKLESNDIKLDIGLAYNQDAEKLFGNYLDTNTYKSMQYAWLNKTWNQFSTSFLLANIGWQSINPINNEEETNFNQTIGTHIKFNQNQLSVLGNLFYQMGKDKAANDLNAYLVGLDANYKISPQFNITLGGEIQSGNDNGQISNNENHAFSPFFGTNHKFNGLMDYFYVGNHMNNVGLIDLHAKGSCKISDKSTIGMAFYKFSAAGELNDKNFGNEIDFTFGHKLYNNVTLNAGYSHMFADKGMEIIKNTTSENTNHWAWAMITISPKLFSSNQ